MTKNVQGEILTPLVYPISDSARKCSELASIKGSVRSTASSTRLTGGARGGALLSAKQGGEVARIGAGGVRCHLRNGPNSRQHSPRNWRTGRAWRGRINYRRRATTGLSGCWS